jgi:uncharacterized protein (TIGR02246 family)
MLLSITNKYKKMKRFNQFKVATVLVVFFTILIACKQSAADETSGITADGISTKTTKADPAKLKDEIQAVETAWANADNSRDGKAVAAFYADDAITLENSAPMVVGHAAIEKNVEAYLGKRQEGVTTAYDVMDVFGCDDYVTEVGKITRKDAAGKTIYTGKYMAIWEKRNGKWICIRDIGNDDVKEK